MNSFLGLLHVSEDFFCWHFISDWTCWRNLCFCLMLVHSTVHTCSFKNHSCILNSVSSSIWCGCISNSDNKSKSERFLCETQTESWKESKEPEADFRNRFQHKSDPGFSFCCLLLPNRLDSVCVWMKSICALSLSDSELRRWGGPSVQIH